MFWVLWKKELKTFFSNKGNLLFMVLLPILLISVFSFALGDYIKGDYGTFDEGKVYYYVDDQGTELCKRFEEISGEITESTGVEFVEVTDLRQARKDVEESKAYGVITIGETGYDYFRSTFNEPQGGKLVRTLFVQLSGEQEQTGKTVIQSRVIQGSHLDSKVYYTFSALTFAILFMGVLIGHSVIEERELGTLIRIQMSRAGTGGMMSGKILAGILCGAGEVCAAFLFSNYILGVKWGEHVLMIFFILLCLILLSAVFGAVVGRFTANKSMCQSTIMMTAMLCGYLGGAITPLYLLENMPILQFVVKASPLYWTNQALLCLYNGIVNEKMTKSICVLIGLSLVVLAIYAVLDIRELGKKKGSAAC
jgi:ABC-2 type transport system permease protein